jgi:hypothetical protein
MHRMKRPQSYKLLAIFVVLFLLVVLVSPANSDTLSRYHLSQASYRILLFATVGIPAFLTWYAAFYGYEQLESYTSTIAKTKEGEAFEFLRRGSKWIALYLPIVTIVSMILLGIANAASFFRGAALIISNYVAVILSLIAFTLVSTGARKIANVDNARPSLTKTRLVTFLFIVMGLLYSYFITKHASGNAHPYYLSPLLMLLTVVLPYFYAWFMGLLALLDIDAYASKVPGILYRKALRLLSCGLLTIIVSSILLQYINSANTNRGRLIFGSELLMRYALYATISAGFLLVGSSAKKLQQIEKI